MQRWVYLNFPSLQLDMMQFAEPTLQQQAMVLFNPLQQEVVQVNELAQQQGVHQGMALSDSWLLVNQLRAEPYQPSQDKLLLQRLAHQLYQKFALIVLAPPNGLWLELAPMLKLHGSEAACIALLQQLLAGQGWRYGWAVADTPLAAQLMAGAKVVGEKVAQLTDLPISATSLTPPLKQRLQRLGWHRLGDLLAQPSALLGRRLGAEIVSFIAQLNGQQRPVMNYYQPPPYFYQRTLLACEINHWQGLRFPLNRLLIALEDYLTWRQQVAYELRLRLYFRDKTSQLIRLGLSHGANRATEILPLLQLRLEREKLMAPVLEVALIAAELGKQTGQSVGLWQQQANTPLSQLINRLHTRLGTVNVRTLQNLAEWLPEHALSQDKVSNTGTLTATTGVNANQFKRPYWLLTEPAPTRGEYWQPCAQPERLSSPWWIADQQRDYVVARDEDGCVGWLFFDHQRQQWFIHGWFS